jgi:hydrogenase expression/formation protein HypD
VAGMADAGDPMSGQSGAMRYVDEFRDPQLARGLLRRIKELLAVLPATAGAPLRIMEVCGGHTHAIFRFGIDSLLPTSLEFIHGPGCPVCVLPMGRIDACVEIATHPQVIFCTYGDAMRVPGRGGSLLDARRRGADVRVVYSPLDALSLAERHPQREVVFFALGFEATMPATALTLQAARARGLRNFSVFCQHITLLPTLRRLLGDPELSIDGILAPGHVSMVIGTTPYRFISERYATPLVVTGFEPLDILQGLAMLLEQRRDGRSTVQNQYQRVVADAGNSLAQRALADVFVLRERTEWRGLGEIEHSGMALAADYADFDAELRFAPAQQRVADEPDSRCAEVLTGRCKPTDCPLFAGRCAPQTPLGALMVSSEGACSAYYQYRRESE